MIGYYRNGEYNEPPEEDPVKLAQYRRHVANGTVPKTGIPYTNTDIGRALKAGSILANFKPNAKPVLPKYFTDIWKDCRTAANFPAASCTETRTYIREFEILNGLKEIPQ